MSSAPCRSIGRNAEPEKIPPRRTDNSRPTSEHDHRPPPESNQLRLAKPGDITGAQGISKGAMRYWAIHLCKYRSAENLVWAKRSTAASDLFVTERSIKIYRRELLEHDWICFPEGDAGGAKPAGAPKGLVIHLHPDGRPCSLPKVNLVQRPAFQDKIQTSTTAEITQSEGEDFSPSKDIMHTAKISPLRGKKSAGKGEENVGAIRNELFMEPLKDQPSTTAVPDLRCDVTDASTNAVAGDGRSHADAQDRRNIIFREMEQMCDPPLAINSVGRTRILRAAQEQNFSLQQLCYAWRRDARSQTGGLISLAEHWLEETAHLSWPRCLDCEDTGTVVPKCKLVLSPSRNDSGHYGPDRRAMSYRAPERRQQGFEFCNCQMGVEAQDATQRAQDALLAEQLQRERESERRIAAAKAAQDLILAAAEASRQRSYAEREAIKVLQADHICPRCEGKRGRQQHGAWHLCVGCLGTGQFFTDEEFQERGACVQCRGTGSVYDNRQGYTRASKKAPWMISCPACHGSGRARTPYVTGGAGE